MVEFLNLGQPMAWWRSKSNNPHEIQESDLPQKFGRYQLEALIGSGGMGRVFHASLQGPAGFQKAVALKLIRATEPSTQARQDFLNEARIGAMLDHPNLVATHDLGEHQGQLYIAMDLVRGIALDTLIERSGPLPGSAALDIAVQLCAGLASAHNTIRNGKALGLVHCDLKPANVLLGHTGLVRLTDFGLAQALGGAAQTEPDRIRGSINYMAPEQLVGDHLDGRTDIYSLGLVVYEMVIGHRLFIAQDRAELIASIQAVDQHMADPFVRTPLDTAIPGLSSVLDRCIRAQPDARFRSVVELGHALRELHPGVQDSRSLVGILEEAGIGDAESLDFSLRDTSSQNFPSSKVQNENTLGPEPNRFVGREAELARLEALISEGKKLITLKGAGGSGKTRLAQRLGRRLQGKLEGGARFCDLSECQSLNSLLQALGATLGTPLSRGEPDELVMLIGHVLQGHGPALLILDNFEQLFDHGPATLSWWRSLAPETVFLVSSRVRLHLPEETVIDVDPLPQTEGIELMVARAEGWTPTEADFEVLEEIVRRLDGLPLAIELAAARLRVLSPKMLLDRLSQRFKLLRARGATDGKRHATLWATIDWSWGLLEPWEQAALAQLSVFRGGFFLEAAEEVLDLRAFPDAPWVMDIVGSLLDRSMIWSRPVQGQPRFGMYESIREYASAHLSDSGDLEQIQRSHARYFSTLGSMESLDALYVHGGLERMGQLTAELENLVAGFEAAAVQEESNLAHGCAIAAITVLQTTGPLQKSCELVERAMALPDLIAKNRIQLLRELSWIRSKESRLEEAIALAKEALKLAQEIQDPTQEARVQSILAFMYRGQSRAAEGDQHYEAALRLARQVGDRSLEGVILNNQGTSWLYLHRVDDARERFEFARIIAHEVGNTQSEGHARGNLAMLSTKLGRISEAREHFMEAIRLFRLTGNRTLEATALSGLASLQHDQGQLEEAMKNSLSALAIHRSTGSRRQECIALGNIGDIHLDRGRLDDAESRLRAAITLGDQVIPEAAGAFRGSLGLLRAARGEFIEAREQLRQGDSQLRGIATEELGKLLCKRARVELMCEDPAAARGALEEAQLIAQTLGVGPEGSLSKEISKVLDAFQAGSASPP